jgi:hypothetical protein
MLDALNKRRRPIVGGGWLGGEECQVIRAAALTMASGLVGTLRRRPDRTGLFPFEEPTALLCSPYVLTYSSDKKATYPCTDLGSTHPTAVGLRLWLVRDFARTAATVSMDDWPDDVPVPSFGQRIRGNKLGATAVPNWSERAEIIGQRPAMTLTRRSSSALMGCQSCSPTARRRRLAGLGPTRGVGMGG